MTAVPIIKIEAPPSDYADVGDHVVRLFAAVPCPLCLRGRLRASAWRDIGDGEFAEFALTCPQCHRDVFTITGS